MKTMMFPGQGSQSKGMGAELFDEFKELTIKADKILGFSIKELCLNDPKNELNQTQYTQPALFVVNALSYNKKLDETGVAPDYVTGHSLGELNALLAAECFDFEVGLKLVQKRGELMSRAKEGGMAAILKSSEKEIEALLEDNGLGDICLANYNTPSQIVISGKKTDIEKAQSVFKKSNIAIVVLKTSGAFHSKYMEPAKVEFKQFMEQFEYSDPEIPVISNVTAKPYENNELVDNLTNQIVSPVRWSESIQYLMGLGDMAFEEIGHGNVMTNLVKKIKDAAPIAAPEAVAEQQGDKNDVKAAPEMNGDQQEPSEEADDADKNRLTAEKSGDVDKDQLTAEEKVVAWNKTYDVGTQVKSILMEEKILETRTEAVVLFGMRAAVYMKDYNGYFDLDEITPFEG